MSLRRALLALVVGSVTAFPLGAAAEDQKPEQIANEYIRAMSDQRVNVVADCMHPAALDNFKTILVEMGAAIERAPADRRPDRMINALFGDDGITKIKDGEPRELFVQFMSNLMVFLPQICEMTAGSEYQIIGHVEEGNLAHVVFRATLRRGEAKLTKMEVLTVKREGLGWKVLLTDDLANLVIGLGRQLASPPKEPAPSTTPPPGPRPVTGPTAPLSQPAAIPHSGLTIRPVPAAPTPASEPIPKVSLSSSASADKLTDPPAPIPPVTATPAPTETANPDAPAAEATPSPTPKGKRGSKAPASPSPKTSPKPEIKEVPATKGTSAGKGTPAPKVSPTPKASGSGKATPNPKPSPTPKTSDKKSSKTTPAPSPTPAAKKR